MIAGKVVAITGASSGIGEAAAELLAERGAKVVLGARDESRLKPIVDRIRAGGSQAEYKPLNVASRGDVQEFVDFASQQFGRLDVLISNAGVMPIGPLDDLAIDDWEQMVDFNVKGVL